LLRRSLVLVAALAVALSLLVSGSTGAAGSTSAFPVSITVTNGKVTVAKLPKRIVSLSPTATETLFAIGAGKQVVAVDDQSDYPKTAPKTSLSGFTPNVEAIAGYKPDLVIASYDPKGMAAALEKLGITVVIQDGAKTLPGAYQQIRQLGTITGQSAGAARVVATMKAKIAKIVARTSKQAAGLSVYHELTPDLYSASSSSFVGKVYALLGLKNIADAADSSRSGYPQLSAEYVVSANPDVIVLADTICCGQKISTVAARPAWDRIKAVKSGSIVRIDDSVASRWGPRLVNLFQALSTAIARLQG
jgi:iron complex transport system substrate-binding protein